MARTSKHLSTQASRKYWQVKSSLISRLILVRQIKPKSQESVASLLPHAVFLSQPLKLKGLHQPYVHNLLKILAYTILQVIKEVPLHLVRYTGAYKHDKNIFAYIADDTVTKVRTCFAVQFTQPVMEL